MRKPLTLSLAAIALVGAGAVYAQTPQTPQRGAEMTRDAAADHAGTMFARLDANSDGQIDEADKAERAKARFDRIDADSNGTIDRAEFAAMHERRGERGARGEQRAENSQRGEHRRGGRRGGHRGGAMGGMVAQADANSDGTITQAEFTNAALTRFDAADANNDGTVTREERRAARPEGRPETSRGQRNQAS